MKQEWLAFLSAVQFLTRLPVPDPGWEEGRLDRAAKWFPLVGALVGLVSGGTFFLFLFLGLKFPLSMLLAILIGILVTGALHEDGLADTADGLGGGQTRERRLAIMKDSSIGTYGALALIFILVFRMGLYPDTRPIKIQYGIGSEFSIRNLTVLLAFVAAHTASRGAMLIVLWSLLYARDEDSAKVPPLTEPASWFSALIAIGTVALASIPVGFILGGGAIAIALITTLIAVLCLRMVFRAKLGGWTGDTAGATQQICEVTFLVGLTAWT